MGGRTEIRELTILYSLYVLPGLATFLVNNEPVFAAPPSILPSLVFQTSFALLILYLLDVHGESRVESFGLTCRGGPAIMIGGVFIIAIALLLLAGVVRFLTDHLETGAPLFPAAPPTTTVWWVVFTLLMVVTGVTEELFFRSYIISRLRQMTVHPLAAVTIAAFLFSLGHLYQGTAAVLFSFFAGILLGTLWLRRPCLFCFALGHGIYNLAALLISIG